MKRALAVITIIAAVTGQAALAEGRAVTVSGITPTLGGDIVLKKVVVKFDDLDPSSKQGAEALFSRVNLVAGALCASNPSGKSAMLVDKVEKCRKTALDQVVKDVGTAEFAAAAK